MLVTAFFMGLAIGVIKSEVNGLLGVFGAECRKGERVSEGQWCS